jgi:hypothetical protein
MKRLFASVLVGLVSVSACGSDSDSESDSGSNAAETTVASNESVPSDSTSTVTDSTVITTTVPEVVELPVANLPPCVIPAGLAVDETGRPYAVSEPVCAGGWMFAYATDCESECESSLAIQSVNGRWKLRGFVYNVCYQGATGTFGLPEVVAKWYIRWSCDSESADDLNGRMDEPAEGPLSLGDYGTRVAQLDSALSASGFLLEAPNDVFDFETLKAVLDLQFQLGLDVDGYAGPMTLGALGLS